MSILVIGSFMMDQVASTPRAPKNGETIIGNKYSVFPGGKGANQAVAAARLGGEVIMAGKVGNDSYGKTFIDILEKEKIDTSLIEKDDKNSTGVGFITSEENGDNRIIVIPGANLEYTKEELSKVDDILDDVNILIIQLEMDISVMDTAIKKAVAKGVKVILNPAPGQELSDDMIGNVDILTPNETELEILTGTKVNDINDAINASKILLEKGAENIIVTLGSNGALIVNKEEVNHIKGFEVSIFDTVAAGDSFNGALAVAIDEGLNLKEAVQLANATGALTVTKEGAIPSLPYREEVNNMLKNNL